MFYSDICARKRASVEVFVDHDVQNVSPRLKESRTECECRRLEPLGLSAAFETNYVRCTQLRATHAPRQDHIS